MTTGRRHDRDESIVRIANWAASLGFDEIPDDVKRRAALVLIDDLACAVGSRDQPELAALKRHLPAVPKEATVFLGGDMKTNRTDAAMINAIASNWCQLDEGHRHVMCHAGLYVVPAAVAEAEASGLGVREALRATVIGYEIVCRFAEAFRFAKPTAHPHALWSALGAAATVATLRRFEPDRLIDALTAASTMTSTGPFGHAVAGALVANAWAGLGVANGFRCADLAACGIAGLQSSPFEVFTCVLGADMDRAALTDGLGERWSLHGGYHKVHSCAQQSHAAVEAMLRLRTRWPIGKGPSSIIQIAIDGHRLALAMDNRDPPTTLAARFSIPHIVAAVCVAGRADADAFSQAMLHDRHIARLRGLVEMRLREPVLPPPHDRAACVTLVFDDGTTLVEECLSAEGGPDRPFPDHTVLEKCEAITREVYPHFARTAARLHACDSGTLDQSWAELVRDLCSLPPNPAGISR